MHSLSRATPRGFIISTTVHREFAADTMTVRGHELGQDVVHVRDLHATMLHVLGIDHDVFRVKHQGLETGLTGVEGARVVEEILV